MVINRAQRDKAGYRKALSWDPNFFSSTPVIWRQDSTVKLLDFPDDTILVDKTPDKGRLMFQRDFDKLMQWWETWRLDFNAVRWKK